MAWRSFCYLVSNTLAFTVACFLALMTLSQNEDEVQVFLSVKWSDGAQPQKYKVDLEKVLQTWSNQSTNKRDYKVLRVSNDGLAVISIKPAAGAVSICKYLFKQKLTTHFLQTFDVDSNTIHFKLHPVLKLFLQFSLLFFSSNLFCVRLLFKPWVSFRNWVDKHWPAKMRKDPSQYCLLIWNNQRWRHKYQRMLQCTLLLHPIQSHKMYVLCSKSIGINYIKNDCFLISSLPPWLV